MPQGGARSVQQPPQLERACSRRRAQPESMRHRAGGAPGVQESRGRAASNAPNRAASNAPNRAAFGCVVDARREVKLFFEI